MPLLLLAACDGGGGEGGPPATSTAAGTSTSEATPIGSPDGTPIGFPEGFPRDFPIYENATITAAQRITAAQGDIYAISMETTDAADSVRNYYESTLAEPPWEVGNVVEIPEQNTVIVEFARLDGGGQAGTVAIQQEQTDGQKTLIGVSLPAPASTGTPAPTP